MQCLFLHYEIFSKSGNNIFLMIVVLEFDAIIINVVRNGKWRGITLVIILSTEERLKTAKKKRKEKKNNTTIVTTDIETIVKTDFEKNN